MSSSDAPTCLSRNTYHASLLLGPAVLVPSHMSLAGDYEQAWHIRYPMGQCFPPQRGVERWPATYEPQLIPEMQEVPSPALRHH